jgi:hypothetical protein
MKRILASSISLCVLLGCAPDQGSPRVNAPPHGPAERESDLGSTFAYMSDNALLANMTVSDMHFLPHRAMLNGLGEQRLTRLAQLMHVYGGTVRFNTDETNELLVRDRLDTITAYLAAEGVDTTTEFVRRDISGGAGMTALEAVLIKTFEATYNPDKEKSSSGGSGSGGMGGGFSGQ